MEKLFYIQKSFLASACYLINIQCITVEFFKNLLILKPLSSIYKPLFYFYTVTFKGVLINGQSTHSQLNDLSHLQTWLIKLSSTVYTELANLTRPISFFKYSHCLT